MPRPKAKPKPADDFADLAPMVKLPDDADNDPFLPGFSMEDIIDQPESTPLAMSVFDANVINKAAQKKFDEHHPPLEGEIISPADSRVHAGVQAGVRYESRIRVLEAYQYPGHLKDAPGWIDRSWAAYSDFDPLRGIPAGPALRVPLRNGDFAMARPGDYTVRQEVILAHGVRPDVQVEVWPKESFERTFIPGEPEYGPDPEGTEDRTFIPEP